MRSKKKLTELEKEKLLNQEEIIDFYYHDKESKTKILVHDKRKIKVALMELDEEERKRRNEILENECPYNQRTDDPMDDELEEQYEELGYEQTELEEKAGAAKAEYEKESKKLVEEVHIKTKDYKTELQELVQAKEDIKPEYVLIDKTGPAHLPEFTMAVEIDGKIYEPATAKSKKEAENLAAKNALKALKK